MRWVSAPRIVAEAGAGFALCVLGEEAAEVMEQTPQRYTHMA